MVIKAGCIDDDGKTNAGFVPKVEIFTRSRVPWMAPVEGAKQEIANFTSFWAMLVYLKGFSRADRAAA